MLNALLANDIHDVVFVAGFHKEQVKDYVQREFPEMRCSWVENSQFDKTNTAYSVFLARDVLLKANDDILLINGDVVLDHRAIHATLAAEGGNVLATQFDRCGAEEVKFRLDDTGRIVEIGKHLAPGDAAGESVGINRISSKNLPALFEMLQKRIEQGEGRSEYYEHSFNALIQEGMEFRTADVTRLPVMEVDTLEDYQAIKDHILQHLVHE